MSSLTLQFDEHPDPDELRQILDGVREYNRGVAGMERPWLASFAMNIVA